MSMRRLKKALILLAAPMPLVGLAQDAPKTPAQSPPTAPPATQKPTEQSVVAGGKVAFDLIRLLADQLATPLRFANVFPGSDQVDLDGRTLRRDVDYAIDYASGVVMLRVPFREGQSLRVQYRYDEKKTQTGVFGSAGQSAQGLKFDFAPGASMMVGFGMTERRADGTLLTSNIYGISNSFNVGGGGTLKGVFLLGERKKSQVQNLFGSYGEGDKELEEGQGQAIVQSLDVKALGGKLKIDYQDIDDRFGGFQSFAGAGFSLDQIKQLEKEKGLKRSGFQLTEAGAPGANVGFGQRQVGDGNGAIHWRNSSVNLGGFKFGWTSQLVERGFARFNDLAEADRGQLAKEKGLDRQSYTAGKEWSGGKLAYNASKIENDDGTGIYRRQLDVQLPWLKVGFFDQHVEKGFNRFGDLREADRQQLAKEAGLIRQSYSVETNMIGRLPFKLGSAVIRSEEGDLKSTDLAYSGKLFGFEHIRREADAGFSAYSAMSEADVQHHLTGIMRMYDPAGPVQGHDRAGFAQMSGLNRSVWRFNLNPAAGVSFKTEALAIESETGRLDVKSYLLNAGRFNISLREQGSTEKFDAGRKLLVSEQQRLGTADGFQKSDLSVSADLSKNQKLNLNRMSAGDQKGDVLREAYSYSDKGFLLSYNRRSIDQAFGSLDSLVDPERDLFRSILGYDQSDLIAKWQLLPGLNVDFRKVDSIDNVHDLQRRWQNAVVNWDISKLTSLGLTRFEQHAFSADGSLIDQKYDRYAIAHNFGRFGKLSLIHEEHEYDGETENLPDATRQTVIYETKLNAKTGLRTENSETKFENGERETTTSNTVSTEISNRVGVSVTDTRILRDGDKKDEQRRNYGFWVDFGKGIKFKYNYARHLDGETDGTKNTETTLTGGEFQGIKLDGATYKHNSWDDKRDQHFGNVSIANAKPFDWGWLKDVRFHYIADTQRDMLNWQKENRSMGFGGSLGRVAFGFDYFSQVNRDGDRAIDRTFTFTTDKTEKASLRAAVRYGVRTLPNDEDVMIRDYSLTFQPNKNWALSHSVSTNRLQDNKNLILGSAPIDERKNSWILKYQNDPKTQFDVSWNEVMRDNKKESLYREARFNLTLFADNPSPLQFHYGLLQWDRNTERQTAHKFGLTFNQRPGLNQSLSFTLENLNWEHSRPKNANLQNWNLRLDYSVRF